MLSQVREKDIALFESLSKGRFDAGERAKVDFRLLIPAYMISELRRGFEIGFLVVLPFLVIDMIVATLTMSMGMMMLPPAVISLPVKVLFFVLVDGWNLLVGSLVRSTSLRRARLRARLPVSNGPAGRGAVLMSILDTSVSGMLADYELAFDDLAERRERQHDRLQESRDRIFGPRRLSRRARRRRSPASQRAQSP